MSYQEKKTIVSILSGVILLAVYSIYAFGKIQSGLIGPDNLKVWASIILVFIGIWIVANIIILIIFHILLSIGIVVMEQVRNGKSEDLDVGRVLELEMVEDEMDKLIGLKSIRNGFVISGIGFMTGLVSLVLNCSPVVMLNIMFISFCVGSVGTGLTQLYFYRKGV